MPQDIADGKLTVNRTVNPDGSVKAYGKTAKAHRTIPLNDIFLDFYKTYKHKMYLVPNSEGQPMTDGQYRRLWDRIQYKLNKAAHGKGHMEKSHRYVLDVAAIGNDLSAHILRHTFATELAEKGYSPAEIQYLMGHATAKLALEVYTHVDKTKITADKMNGVKTVSKKTKAK